MKTFRNDQEGTEHRTYFNSNEFRYTKRTSVSFTVSSGGPPNLSEVTFRTRLVRSRYETGSHGIIA